MVGSFGAVTAVAPSAAAVAANQFAWPATGHTDANDVAWHQANEGGSRAVDIQAPANTEVGAAQSGTVAVASSGCANSGSWGCGRGFGNYVVIRHDRPGISNPLYTLYAHLHSGLAVGVGAQVVTGQRLGAIALSGSTTGYHTHFAISTCASVWWGSTCTIWNGADTTSATVYKGNPIPGTYPQLGSAESAEHYRPFAADFNGDGLAEIGLRDPSNGIFYWRYGPDFANQTAYGWAAGSHYQAFAADFNGDRLADIGLRDPSNGIFYWRYGPDFANQAAYGWAAGSHYQAFAADFNGDGLADIGVRDPSNGIFYWRYGPDFANQAAYGWAAGSHYRPFAADLNGDGLADIGVRDPSNGIFYWRYGPDFANQAAYGWAAGSHYQPFAADFNGDRLAEIGVRDPSNGILYWRYGPNFASQGAYGWAAG